MSDAGRTSVHSSMFCCCRWTNMRRDKSISSDKEICLIAVELCQPCRVYLTEFTVAVAAQINWNSSQQQLDWKTESLKQPKLILSEENQLS